MNELSSPATLEEKLTALHDRKLYPNPVTRVESVETHCAWVFLTDQYAYKLKKPMRLDRMDNHSLESRLHNCQEEVRLNRRLAPAVYLGVVPLVRGASGQLMLEQDGFVVEWLVKMRRLPRERFLDRVAAQGPSAEEAVDRAALLLAEFYAHGRIAPPSTQDYRDRIGDRIRANHRALLDPRLTLPAHLVHYAFEPQYRFLDDHAALLDERSRWIVEGHGDLKPEHIFLGPPPCVIDCLEFDRDLRIVDPVEELSALALECERLGAAWIGERMIAAYCGHCADPVAAPLCMFYESRRATQRALTAAWHLLDPTLRGGKDWADVARQYLLRAFTRRFPDQSAPRDLPARTPTPGSRAGGSPPQTAAPKAGCEAARPDKH